MFIEQIATDPFYYFSWITLAAFSICCHEYAHAYTALRVGDDTAARAGHLTLNPLVQMGIQSLLMLIFFGIAWGAVPVNLSQVRAPRHRALISLAGPLANLLLCLIFALLTVLAHRLGNKSLETFLFVGGAANGMLFILNILPVPVFDGFATISAFNPKLELFAQKYSGPVFILFIVLLWSTPLGSMIFGTGFAIQHLFMSLFQLLFSLGS